MKDRLGNKLSVGDTVLQVERGYYLVEAVILSINKEVVTRSETGRKAVRPGDAFILLETASHDWRPIDSAPKDGSYILAILDIDDDCSRTFVPAVVAWDTKKGYWADATDEEGDDCEFAEWKLTHWKPLPNSPSGREYLNHSDCVDFRSNS